MNRLLLLFISVLLYSVSVNAQIVGDYRSTGTVNFTSATNWQVWNGTTWTSASSAPTSASSSNTITIQSGNTATSSSTTIAANLVVNGTLNVSSNFTTGTLTINGNSGVVNLQNANTYTVNGSVTVNSGATFNANYNPGTSTYLIVYGNYINNGTTDFWKATAIITGDLLSPSTSTLQNNGNVVVGGNIIGSFDTTGGDGSGQIYALNSNATVDITPTSIDNNVTPGASLNSTDSAAIGSLVNQVLYGATCSFTVNDVLNVTTCAGSNATFTVSTNAISPSYQWQVNTGSSWVNLTNSSPYSGVNTSTLVITNIPSGYAGYKYRARVTASSCTANGDYGTLLLTTPPTSPIVGTITQPTCTLSSGSVVLSGLPASGTWTLTRTPGNITTTGSGTSTTISGLTSGTYTYTVTNSNSCISSASNNIVINSTTNNTWNGSSWSAGSNPNGSQDIIFSGNYSSTGDITGCSCKITSGNVIINAGHTLTLTNDLTVQNSGSLTFEDTSSLVQTSNIANSGNITFKRKTTPLKQYDYTYWSSPVSGTTLGQLATNSLFYSFNPSINNWVWQASTTSMTAGVGYIGRAPSGLNYSTSQIVETNFSGIPNNGTITTPIIKGSGTFNLIGNPYPSAIDIDIFLTDASNSSVVNGTIYLWTHNTAITNNVYTANDYAKYNFTGSVRTSSAALTGGAVPTGKIAAGQGFFIEANSALANGTYTATFKNSMRVSGNNNQFFRNSTNATQSGSVSQNLERHRIWLSLSDDLGAYNQMLVGYIQGATNDIDVMYDGKTVPVGNSVSIYTILGNDNLSIQGKALPFSQDDIIPIGYSTTINGQLKISLDNFDGVFANENVYLYDKATGVYHDLKSGDFTFTTVNGTYNNRFEVRFSNTALGVSNPTITDDDIKLVSNNNQLTIYSPLKSIEKVQVFDVLGKLIYSQNNLNTTIFETNQLAIAPQMLVVKVTLENSQTITKKTLIQ